MRRANLPPRVPHALRCALHPRLTVINPEGVIEHITMNNFPVGRNVDEAKRTLQVRAGMCVIARVARLSPPGAFPKHPPPRPPPPPPSSPRSQAVQFVAEHGEVCPAGWKPGDATMVADPEKSLDYFESLKEEVGWGGVGVWERACAGVHGRARRPASPARPPPPPAHTPTRPAPRPMAQGEEEAAGAKLLKISSKKDLDDLVAAGGRVVLKAWAPWCAKCRMIAPLVDELQVLRGWLGGGWAVCVCMCFQGGGNGSKQAPHGRLPSQCDPLAPPPHPTPPPLPPPGQAPRRHHCLSGHH